MRTLTLAAGLLGLSISACAPKPAPPPSLAPAQVEAGAKLATLHCARCHAVGATGASVRAEAPPLRTLSQRYPVDQLEEAFAEGVLTGHPAMPEFRFSPTEVDALLAYIQSIQERKAG